MKDREEKVPFREKIKDAPEFGQYIEVNTIVGLERWPLSEVKDEESEDKVIFVAKSTPSELAPTRMKISYESPYDLRVRRMVLERIAKEEEHVMECAEIKFSIDDLEISYVTHLKGPLAIQEILEEPRNFVTSIYVTSKNHNNIPPIASVTYDLESKIQVNAKFPNADFEKILTGDFEKVEKDRFGQASYSETYLQWEYMVGAKVGVSRFTDTDYPNRLRFRAWNTNINNRGPKIIEDTAYQGKITRSLRAHPMQAHRLRFSRINKESGQSIMLSVPDHIDPYRFHNHIQHETLISFFWEYPVVFCVKNKGEERKWYSTGRQTDKA